MNERTIVVGMDSSTESNAALDWARGLAGPDDRIIVVHAWDIPAMSGYDMVLAVDVAEIERSAQQGLDDLVARVEDDRLVPVVRRGHAGRALVAEAEAADLVVVGHRGNSRLALMLGSTANYVMHHSETPVVVVRGEFEVPPRHVVVGVDDFDMDGTGPCDNASVRALVWAMNLPDVDRITVIHAWFVPPLAIGLFQPLVTDLSSMDDAALAVTNRVIEAAGAPPDGVEVTAVAARGTGGFALIEASRDADMVVVGRRERNMFSELLLGSTSAETAAHAHAPVAVVH